MQIRKSQVIIVVFLLSLCFPLGIKEISCNDENPGPFFYITVIAPLTSPARNQWADLLVDLLPQIGIGIDLFDRMGWAQISPRVWGYPGPYPIPTFEYGGYDIFFIGWGWGLDFNPTSLYHSTQFTPNGENFYQYNSSVMDFVLNNYTSSINSNERLFWAKEMQKVFYEDQPSITIVYSAACYAHHPDFYNWDGLLWASSYQPMENWTIPGQTEFHYAAPADFEDFHIYKYESVYDAQWLRQIYNGLFERYASLGNLYGPRLANSWETFDGLNYTVHLNPNSVWADGEPLNASDVEFSYKLQINPSFGCPDYTYWSKYLRNNSITIIDEHTVTISFNESYLFHESNLALDLLPKHIWESIPYVDMEAQAKSWALTEPSKIFGAGPYRLHSYNNVSEIIHLIRNENFTNWSGIDPYFNDLYFEFFTNKESALLALESGSIDMVDCQFSTQISEVPETATYELVEDSGVQEIAINNIHPYLGTGEACPITGIESAKHIRKAISHITPRDEIIDDIFMGLGYPGVTPYPNVAVGFDKTLKPYEYNKNLALEHMSAAGFEIDDKYFTTTPTIIIGYRLDVIIGILIFLGSSILVVRRIRMRFQEKMKMLIKN